jgi:hypothetical protein
MKTELSYFTRWLTGLGALFTATTLYAAPLAWFPGPPTSPVSSAATTILSDKSILVIAGDDYYDFGNGIVQYGPRSLGATNQYWTSYTPYDDSIRLGAGVVDSGGSILLFGGTDGTSSTNSGINYSTSDGVTAMASMISPRSYFGYTHDSQGTPYAIGGLDDAGQPLALGETYNADANTWTAMTALPVPLFYFPAVYDPTNSSIYAFGGYTDLVSGVESSAVYAYSTKTKKWTSVAPLPVAVVGSVAVYGVDGKIYVAGGISGGVATAAVQVYNPVSNTWALSTPLPEALSGSTMGVDSLGRLVVIGGMDGTGYDTGDVWRSQPLTAPDAAPSITQHPATNAVYTNLYASMITASGNPPPTYSLISGPAGMQVDYFSGAISWTPTGIAQIGVNPVTIQASNYSGTTNWTFNITVPNPPPSPVSNLTVVSVTGNSVTLSWSPEDPVVGPVTYSAFLRHAIHGGKGSGATVWYTQIGSSTTNTSLTIGGIAPGLSQAYYIVAVGPGGSSGTNAAVAATTASVQPPPNLRVTGLTSTTLSLAWDAPGGLVPAATYQVWGWYNGGINYTIFGSGLTATSLTVTGLTPGGSYQWGVRAFDALGYASAFNYGFSVVNPIPVQPALKPAGPLPDGTFQLTGLLASSDIQTVLLEATTDVSDPASWVQIGSVYPSTNVFQFIDTNAAQFPARFYRVIAP